MPILVHCLHAYFGSNSDPRAIPSILNLYRARDSQHRDINKLCPESSQDIRGIMSLLKALPAVNLELWAQLAQAAGTKGCWPLARQCAVAALGALPPDASPIEELAAAGQYPGLTKQAWFWYGVAEWQHGQVWKGDHRIALGSRREVNKGGKRRFIVFLLASTMC